MKIKIDSLCFSYPDSDVKAIRDLDLSLESDKIYAVMGKNGSGKTTLLKLIVGLLKPDSGDISFEGFGRGVEIGYSPEDPELGFFEGTVKEEVEFYPENLGLDHERIAEDTLKKMGISHLNEKVPTILSSGQQRLVSIASVLSGNPELLILDEPTHSLHRKGEEMIGEIFDKLDMTILFSTHSSDFALEFADQAIVMDNGKLLDKGHVERVLTDEEILEKAGIRTPGPVRWARENSLKSVPSNVKEAICLMREGSFE